MLETIQWSLLFGKNSSRTKQVSKIILEIEKEAKRLATTTFQIDQRIKAKLEYNIPVV